MTVEQFDLEAAMVVLFGEDLETHGALFHFREDAHGARIIGGSRSRSSRLRFVALGKSASRTVAQSGL